MLNTGFPDYKADAQTTIFAAGQLVRVSLVGDPQKKKPDLELLTDLDEAWAMCFRKPRPGWRLFGRFVDRNVFIGLCLVDRNQMKGFRAYGQIAQNMIDKWNRDFSSLHPVRSNSLADYLSGTIRDVYSDGDF